GEVLRQKLHGVAQVLREALSAVGVECLGKPGPIVPVLLGPEAVGRITAALCFDRGVFANLVGFPAVSVGESRVRIPLLATHTSAQALLAAEVIGWAYKVAQQLLAHASSAGTGI